MELQIDVNGRVRLVTIEPCDGAYRVTIDGRDRLVDAAAVDDATYSLVCLSEARASIQAGLAETGQRGEMAVHMANGVATVRVLPRGTNRFGRGAAGPGQVSGAKQVLAPMPGKIVRILVKPGDAVAARQGLIVVEAMKMENELRSPKEGRVTDVLVTEGTSVEAGRVLVVVE